MPILTFVLRRLLHALPLLVCVIVFNFFLIHLAPGDPIQALVGEFPAPAAYLAEMRKLFGLDQPLYIQLLLYVRNILSGDLGFSFYYRQPVLSVIMDRVPATLQLMLPALVFSAAVGILLGILSARKPYSLADNAISAFSLFGYCVPAFWFGQMLMAALRDRARLAAVARPQNRRRRSERHGARARPRRSHRPAVHRVGDPPSGRECAHDAQQHAGSGLRRFRDCRARQRFA